ncbi:MAG: PorT family protein [Prevotellaceae bacterium]|jgi:hypothetical protein|nr:PorT family protein [Prevotellaceae bacterium]
MKKQTLRQAALALVLFTVTATAATAQVGDQRHNLALGVNAGVNLNSVSFSPTVRQKNQMGYTAGVTARYISERYFKMICGAQVEVNLSQHGWNEFYEEFPDLSYTRTTNYVEIPFLAHLAFGREPRGIQFFIHAGPQIGFYISDSHTISDNWDTVTGATVEQHDKKVDKPFDYGIAAGAGLELRTRAGNFLVEGRYYYGLSDFYGTTKKDYFSRAANSAITVKVSYLFDMRK